MILSLEQDLPDKLPLDNASLLALLSSGTDRLNGQISLQSKKNLNSAMNQPYPYLKYILLKDINFDDKIEDIIPISRWNLDLIYLWNCKLKTDDFIWSALDASMNRINSMQPETIHIFRFLIQVHEHTTQIVINKSSSVFTSISLNLIHGLVLPLDQALPNHLLVDKISFLVLLPSTADSSNFLSPQSRQNLKPITTRVWPKLKYLFLGDVSPEVESEMFDFTWKHRLDYVFSNIFMLRSQ